MAKPGQRNAESAARWEATKAGYRAIEAANHLAFMNKMIAEYGSQQAICAGCKKIFDTPKSKTRTRIRCAPCESLTRVVKGYAMGQVSRAIKRGDLRPAREFPCTDCGGAAVEYDHRDYAETLKVDPVCRSCNLRRGPADISRLLVA